MLEIAILSITFSLSVLALACSGASWWYSRAAQVRHFNSAVEDQMMSHTRRIEMMEGRADQSTHAVQSMVEEITGLLERTMKERRRISSENQRGRQANGEGEGLTEGMSRSQQLEHVRRHFGNG